MSEEIKEGFKPIETQEELDNIIKDRLKRERESTQKRYEGWISPEDHQKALDASNKAFDDFKRLDDLRLDSCQRDRDRRVLHAACFNVSVRGRARSWHI